MRLWWVKLSPSKSRICLKISLRSSWILTEANASILVLIRRKDVITSYDNLGPIHKAFHMIVVRFAFGKYKITLACHKKKVSSYFDKL